MESSAGSLYPIGLGCGAIFQLVLKVAELGHNFPTNMVMRRTGVVKEAEHFHDSFKMPALVV
jgi:hypothetical protein